MRRSAKGFKPARAKVYVPVWAPKEWAACSVCGCQLGARTCTCTPAEHKALIKGPRKLTTDGAKLETMVSVLAVKILIIHGHEKSEFQIK